MNPDQQRIKIAEACGWSNVKIYPRSDSNKRHSEDTESIGIGCRHPSWGGGSCSVPNYPHDLNAMHEAEKVLTDAQWLEYRDELRTVVLGPVRMVSDWYKADLHATAAQRAEAFLKTLKLWVE